jgi:2-oxoglutarate dehydrogenase E1 component
MSSRDLFHGPNAGYILELYERYQKDPQSVDAQTRTVFEQWASMMDEQPVAVATQTTSISTAPTFTAVPSDTSLDVPHVVGAARLIRYIRELGHLDARIDPLGSSPHGDPGLDPAIHHITDADLAALPAGIVRGPLVEGSQNALEAVTKLRQAYAGTIGYETDHIQTFEERAWIREAIESRRFFYGFDAERKRDLLQRLTEVEIFEQFIHKTLIGQKRFSIEGCDMLVPMLDSIIRNAASGGTREVVIGMAHRGRLNVLAHVLGKPYEAILSEFHAAGRDAGHSPAGNKSSIGWAGDVKYHLGARRAYKDAGIEQMPLTLAPNPSHLEFVNPVVEGRARAAQERRDRPGAPAQDEHASLAILMHGDAAFPGQGVVAETLNLSSLKGYQTGGTIHIITNNQIGFTTEPRDSRSTLYAADLAKGFEIPIVHVNADDAEACIAVSRMAYAYRERFGKDFVIDLVGYRRWGHNEGDEPSFTQPQMYQQITAHPTVRALFAEKLEREGAIPSGEADRMVAAVTERLQEAWRKAQLAPHEDRRPKPAPPGIARRTATAVPAETLIAINEALLARLEDFTPNSRLERTLTRRRAALETQGGIDWAHAEALAFGSILAEGIPIRLTGQDSERGTFSQRHLMLHDANTGRRYCPLQSLPQAKASFAVYNSPLSEAAALGFEYGYSSHAPGTLVLWEAQFGDFANGAQVIIDQFIVSGRSKWGQLPALVLLLPHGYEGQGPEHSSARLERFLQLAADDNIRVANCTTAAQYFHLLRRQAALLTTDPRPLIIMTPKSLLRHPRAGSSLADLAESHFERVIDDPTGRERVGQITRLILCSGKVYVDVIASQEYSAATHIALARVEEFYSFPSDELRAIIGSYPMLNEIVWLQEEPRNMGAWSYMEPRLRALLPNGLPLIYVGRPESATPSEGSLAEHTAEQALIVKEALNVSMQTPVSLAVSTQADG